MRDEGGPIPSHVPSKIMKQRTFRLLEMHQRIDEALRRELRRRWPDPFRVVRLKKLKLHVKDRLYGLTAQPLTA